MSEHASAVRFRSGQGPVVAAVAVGGAVGAAARYGAALLWPTGATAFPWTTLLVNVTGCALMGVLMVALERAGDPHPLLRPLLGTGVLGGYTTFSTYVADIGRLAEAGRAVAALSCLVVTPLAATAAVWAADRLARRAGR